MLNQDFKDMLQCLLDENVDFLLVGGYALAAHGFPRATKDMDIWVCADPENARKVYRALCAFGAPGEQVSPEDFANEGIIFQVGVAPNRIDFITQVDGVSFQECRRNATTVVVEGITIPLIAKADLIKNKKASGRPQDLVDANLLESGD
ncbi:MAG: hypothetical protein WDZ30_03920 [Cellvibrionaceae bacterium]